MSSKIALFIFWKVNVVNEKLLDGAGRIALGTVQLGLDYGINEAGKVQIEEVRKILSYARGHQIDTLDTAIAYGDSERVLGEAGVSGCKIVTKLPVIPKKCKNIEEIDEVE